MNLFYRYSSVARIRNLIDYVDISSCSSKPCSAVQRVVVACDIFCLKKLLMCVSQLLCRIYLRFIDIHSTCSLVGWLVEKEGTRAPDSKRPHLGHH